MFRILLIVTTLDLVSCVHDRSEQAGRSACCDRYESMQTGAQGVSASKRDERDKGFRILRYDMPPFLSGDVDSLMRDFRHFGIEYSDEFLASLEYCHAYNAEMDRKLLERYGTDYHRLRSKILPKPGVGRFQYNQATNSRIPRDISLPISPQPQSPAHPRDRF